MERKVRVRAIGCRRMGLEGEHVHTPRQSIEWTFYRKPSAGFLVYCGAAKAVHPLHRAETATCAPDPQAQMPAAVEC